MKPIRGILYGLFLTFLVAGIAIAATRVSAPLQPPAPPAVTAEQKLQVQLTLEHLKLLQAQMQNLQGEFNTTKAALQVQLKGLERPGYDLNLETWQYVKSAEKK